MQALNIFGDINFDEINFKLTMMLRPGALGGYREDTSKIKAVFAVYRAQYEEAIAKLDGLNRAEFMDAYWCPDEYEKHIKKQLQPMTLAQASKAAMDQLAWVAYLQQYGDNDIVMAEGEYYELYHAFTRRWPHLKSALPTPEDASRGNLPEWAYNHDRHAQ